MANIRYLNIMQFITGKITSNTNKTGSNPVHSVTLS